MDVVERKDIVLTQEPEKLKTSHIQTLLARNAKICDLKVQLARSYERADDAENGRDEAKAHSQQLQSRQQRYKAAVF